MCVLEFAVSRIETCILSIQNDAVSTLAPQLLSIKLMDTPKHIMASTIGRKLGEMGTPKKMIFRLII